MVGLLIQDRPSESWRQSSPCVGSKGRTIAHEPDDRLGNDEVPIDRNADVGLVVCISVSGLTMPQLAVQASASEGSSDHQDRRLGLYREDEVRPVVTRSARET